MLTGALKDVSLDEMRLGCPSDGNGRPEARTHGGFTKPKLTYDTRAIKIDSSVQSAEQLPTRTDAGGSGGGGQC